MCGVCRELVRIENGCNTLLTSSAYPAFANSPLLFDSCYSEDVSIIIMCVRIMKLVKIVAFKNGDFFAIKNKRVYFLDISSASSLHGLDPLPREGSGHTNIAHLFLGQPTPSHYLML